MIDVDLEDWRPSTLFDPHPMTRGEKVAGGITAISAVVLFPLVVGGVAAAVGALTASAEDEVETYEVIETRFVKLGKPDPKLLPSNLAPTPEPAKNSVPPPAEEPEPVAEPAPVAPVEKPVPSEEPDTKEKPTESADDLLDQLTQNADAIASSARAPDREGHEEGIAEGTETEANENLYIGKLYAYFRRGWEVPTHIAEDELKKLMCKVDVAITNDARVGSYKVIKPSGNDAFDRSVELRLSQAEGATLPEPPDDVAARFLGKTITLRFTPPKSK